ncbi:Rpn family recombination-promoting nuclease/putative transposase [Fodinicurvata sp. EGI_FJ10296]|uniref:Rpn family recombination-promoting nuclease/putative transposase n=1 Tax=Fodinicurvata sp. EGI_FJ10296 TaxID=3231908 RepID=UPI003456FE13
MPPPTTPHDALFKALLDDPRRAAAVLNDYLPPEIVPLLGHALPEPVDGSFIDEDLANSQSDRLFRVRTRDGRSALVYALLEHKSSVDPATPIQLGTYLLRIWRRHGDAPDGNFRRLPPIIPIVFYHGRQPWSVPTAIIDCIDADAPLKEQLRDLRYTVHHLNERPDNALSNHRDVAAVFMALKHLRDEPAAFDILVRILGLPAADTQLLKQLIQYILTTQPSIDRDGWQQLISAARPQEEDTVMSIAIRQWQEEGRLQGLVQGKAEGKAEGMAESLIQILETRFHRLDQNVKDCIRMQSAEALSMATKRALVAPTFEQAVDGLTHH